MVPLIYSLFALLTLALALLLPQIGPRKDVLWNKQCCFQQGFDSDCVFWNTKNAYYTDPDLSLNLGKH